MGKTEIATHPEMKNIAWSIKKISEDLPCPECERLKASLGSAQAQVSIWKKMHRELKKRQESVRVSGKQMKRICGGKFPKDPHGFNFDLVPEWKFSGRDWVPYNGYGEPLPGPDLRIKVELVPFID